MVMYLHDSQCIAKLRWNGHITVRQQSISTKRSMFLLLKDRFKSRQRAEKNYLRSVLPICNICRTEGKKPLTKGAVQTAKAVRGKKKLTKTGVPK